MGYLRAVDRIMSEMPFEVLITFLCLATGLPMAVGILPSPASLIRVLPGWSIQCWGAMLSMGGLLTFVGLGLSHATKHRKFIEGLYIEGAGMLILGAGTLVFGLTIAAAAGWRALFGMLVYFVMAASCFFRFRTLRRTVSEMKKAVEIERGHLHGD